MCPGDTHSSGASDPGVSGQASLWAGITGHARKLRGVCVCVFWIENPLLLSDFHRGLKPEGHDLTQPHALEEVGQGTPEAVGGEGTVRTQTRVWSPGSRPSHSEVLSHRQQLCQRFLLLFTQQRQLWSGRGAITPWEGNHIFAMRLETPLSPSPAMRSSRSREEEGTRAPGTESARALGAAQDGSAGPRMLLHTYEMGFASLSLSTPELDQSCFQTWISQACRVPEII